MPPLPISTNNKTTNIHIEQLTISMVQNNNPSIGETSKFLDKFKPNKNKSLSAIFTIILGVAINQIIPQINDINLIYKSVFWLIIAFVAYFFSL